MGNGIEEYMKHFKIQFTDSKNDESYKHGKQYCQKMYSQLIDEGITRMGNVIEKIAQRTKSILALKEKMLGIKLPG